MNFDFKDFLKKYYNYIPDPLIKRKFPYYMTIEPTNRCNLKCRACPQSEHNRTRGDMDFEDFKIIIDKIPDTVRKLDLHFMGEPFLNKDIFKMISYAESKGLYTTVDTNSTTLINDYKDIVDSGLSKLKCSLDGFSQESLSKYRIGSNFDDIKEGIRKLCRYRDERESDIDIILTTLVFSFVEPELERIKQFAGDIGVDRHDLLRPIIEDWARDTEKIDEPPKEYRRNTHDRERPPYCPHMTGPLVTWDGSLITCCFDVEGEYKFGDLLDNNFDDIYWDKGSGLRKGKASCSLDICPNCQIEF